ncbi:MAG: acyl-CoA dehydrogenase family protein [Chloroflexi bacterium]|nr:acyl-CoA dehydrogenase family protein [Chloroflexota bacterium]
MDFRPSAEEEGLRADVCEFLREELGTTHESDPAPMPPGYMPAREFELKLGARGWLARSWPVEYGGGGRPIAEQFIIEEEIALHGGPASDALSRCIIAPMIEKAGNDYQKQRYLPQLARGEITICLGYTEPEAGSDFASLKTTAIRDGDDYVVNGRKIYTSGAESSEYCWLAARTDSESPKHAGISVMMLPMNAPGVEVRPLTNLLDENWFNEVTFDNVRVPVTELIGRENDGWAALTSALGIERITIYRAYIHWRALRVLVRHARAEGHVGVSADRLAQIRIEYEIAGLLLHRAIQMHSEGVDYRAQAAAVKVFNTEFAQHLYEEGMGLLGAYGQLRDGDHHAPWDGAITHTYLSVVQDTIGGGTTEIQKEIIALRRLGLPRG